MSQDFAGLQRGAMRDDLQQQIVKLGIDYRLMTPFTSFVAVEDKVITEGGARRRVEVPVEMPDGMTYEGFGSENRLQSAKMAPMGSVMADRAFLFRQAVAAPMAPPPPPVSNLDPAITALIARVNAGGRPSVDEAYLRLTLFDASPDAQNQLRRLGLVITSQQGNLIQGHIPLTRLEVLSKLPIVHTSPP